MWKKWKSSVLALATVMLLGVVVAFVVSSAQRQASFDAMVRSLRVEPRPMTLDRITALTSETACQRERMSLTNGSGLLLTQKNPFYARPATSIWIEADEAGIVQSIWYTDVGWFEEHSEELVRDGKAVTD